MHVVGGGDLDGPALSVVPVRHRAALWVPGGIVTCLVAGRDYTLIPNFAFWDWEQVPDDSYETLTFNSFDIPETREAFGAMVRHDQRKSSVPGCREPYPPVPRGQRRDRLGRPRQGTQCAKV